jgi:hypothetical protein
MTQTEKPELEIKIYRDMENEINALPDTEKGDLVADTLTLEKEWISKESVDKIITYYEDKIKEDRETVESNIKYLIDNLICKKCKVRLSEFFVFATKEKEVGLK